MRVSWQGTGPWWLAWLGLVLAGSLAIVRMDIAERRAQFEDHARTAHRLLSQRAAQNEAVLATLALLSRPSDEPGRAEQRLGAIYPQVLAVLRRDRDAAWPESPLHAAEQRSRASRHAEVASFDAASGRYVLLLAGEPSSHALRIDLKRTLQGDDGPLQRNAQVRVAVRHGGQAVLLQPGQPAREQPLGLTSGFTFAQPLSTASQPFEVQLQLATGPAQWPWARLISWAAVSGASLAALAAWRAGRRERRRSDALQRVAQAARLGALGELAGGMAHELNQPLAAVLANAQAARRLLDDEPPALDAARHAMTQASAQARRAADVVTRLRRLMQAPDSALPRQPVLLQDVLRNAAALLGPEARQRSIALAIEGEAPAVLADPVALEQIVHNLVRNAMQALEEVPAPERRLALAVRREGEHGVLSVRDSGTGIAPEAMPRLFEPFFTTRQGGLGLGLSLCESLARSMQGSLSARSLAPRGAEFQLTLALAAPSP